MSFARFALRRPHTFLVAAIFILLIGVASVATMTTDVFPVIDLPVITVIWAYPGITPDDMEKRFVYQSERSYSTAVNDIEHTESQSLAGVGVIRIYLHEGANVAEAVAQVTAASQNVLKYMPPGTVPPLVIRYDASDVPVIQAAISSPTLTESQLFDYGQNFIRTQLSTVRGTQIPQPYGGKARVINVDINNDALLEKGLSPNDVANAVSAQNLVLPSGDAKIGSRDYTVTLNSSPDAVAALNDLPVRYVNGALVTIGQVAQVHDGFAVQTNLVNINGRRSVLIKVLKHGGVSTLDVVAGIRQILPRVLATLPSSLKIALIADQSAFVRAAIQSVVREATIAACLTALLILLFLGSLRSTLIVAASIPLSILVSIVCLNACGQTLNMTTLGGLALAVGILVDNTTITIENIDRNIGMGKSLRAAIVDGCAEIAMPALVSSLAICIVFAPMVILKGVSRYLFLPMAEAVIFAILASFVLSQTLTPVLAEILLRSEVPVVEGEYFDEGRYGHEFDKTGVAPAKHRHAGDSRSREPHGSSGHGVIGRIHSRFNAQFERLRENYKSWLAWALLGRLLVVCVFIAFCVVSLCLYPFIGRDFFPQVDAGEIRLHVRVPPSTRIEDTAVIFSQVENSIRTIIGARDLNMVVDDIGLPPSNNLAYGDNATVAASDGEILISLNEGHRPTADYVRRMRTILPRKFPQETFFFQPADIINQILNFGLPAPIDIQISGPTTNKAQNLVVARELEGRVRQIRGAVDVHLGQVVDAPSLTVDVDRSKAEQVGITQRDVASSMLVALSGTSQANASYYLNPRNGVVYNVVVQTPQYLLNTPESVLSTPVRAPQENTPELLGNIATLNHGSVALLNSHYNIMPVFDIDVNVQDRDLGGVSSDIDRAIASVKKDLPPGSVVMVRGQVQSMADTFAGLGIGICGALILVYLLLVINFQSWIDPLIVVSGAPGVFSGILWMLFATRTTFNVPSLTGTIMTIGVSAANSVLVVAFANQLRQEGRTALDAALIAGHTRLRPVLMTALAMIIGMLPMALGLGEGGEQNAPLGRAVIGGLLTGTISTLFIVPIAYSVMRRGAHRGAPHPGKRREVEREPQAVS